jgi:hypothetical protein
MIQAAHQGSVLLAVWCAAAKGGALYGAGSTWLVVRSSTLQANTASTWGGGLVLYDTATGLLANSFKLDSFVTLLEYVQDVSTSTSTPSTVCNVQSQQPFGWLSTVVTLP